MKPPLQYWFCRVYALAFWLLMVASVLYWAYATDKHDQRWLLLVFAWVPLFLPLVSMTLTLGAFPVEYSAFGKLKRSPLPVETPLKVFAGGGVLIGNGMNAPGTLIVYPSGLGLKLILVGTVFLPRDSIDALQRSRWWGVALHHHCPEIRTPVRVTPYVANILFEHWGKFAPDAILV